MLSVSRISYLSLVATSFLGFGEAKLFGPSSPMFLFFGASCAFFWSELRITFKVTERIERIIKFGQGLNLFARFEHRHERFELERFLHFGVVL